VSVERVLFLDIDGVLNHATSRPVPDAHGLAAWLDPTHLEPLNRVATATNARIVVSSSWRVGRSVEDLRVLLRDFGVVAPVVGATPVLAHRPRSQEIAAWLAKHPAVTAYAIVDDELHIEDGPLAPRLVKTSMRDGLTEAHVAPLVERLSLPYRAPWAGVAPGSATWLELAHSHVLFGRSLRTVARRADTDDVLLELDGGGVAGALAVVRLGGAAAGPTWPPTKIYAARWRFEEERMLPDAADWRQG